MSIASLAMGLLTSVAEEAAPELLGKVAAISTVDHDVQSFQSHNPTLAPVLTSLITYLEGEAETHGFGAIEGFVTGLFPFLSSVPSATVVAPPATSSSGAVAAS